ncbi:MAG: sigma-70 family RNA polymerase sigma factor [Candidatus Pacebacteria bacterium]|nr:sigma-70 family RNA polymerase sigma factor [Candidatus Paceibacterota bacterium]
MVSFELQQKNFNKLAVKLREGQQKAGEEIFDYFSPKIYSFFMARTSHRETAEDLTQTVFLKLISKISTFNEKTGNFSIWFWQIVRNALTDYYREHKPIFLDNVDMDKKTAHSNSKEAFQDILAKDQVREVLETIKGFSEEEQEIFSLRYVSSLSYKELSFALSKPEGALRVAVHRLSQKIKKAVTKN